jgi:hypothetical protein
LLRFTGLPADYPGRPDDIAKQIVEYDRKVGGFEIASLQVNFNTLALDAK